MFDSRGRAARFAAESGQEWPFGAALVHTVQTKLSAGVSRPGVAARDQERGLTRQGLHTPHARHICNAASEFVCTQAMQTMWRQRLPTRALQFCCTLGSFALAATTAPLATLQRSGKPLPRWQLAKFAAHWYMWLAFKLFRIDRADSRHCAAQHVKRRF